ncbi:hypothetical protein DM01DRAFT_1386195 [Hesseltinella vesiculosa]|uniref:Uncharacterized protein n=1 Tax=Hesseltinella vesiculosa TaxID=101127 RepID=A0A1X2G6U8_9FUNG|nr:hypothetical protein DM01DRAFT_1386195 [Hesseltinella vesiculosa]
MSSEIIQHAIQSAVASSAIDLDAITRGLIKPATPAAAPSAPQVPDQETSRQAIDIVNQPDHAIITEDSITQESEKDANTVTLTTQAQGDLLVSEETPQLEQQQTVSDLASTHAPSQTGQPDPSLVQEVQHLPSPEATPSEESTHDVLTENGLVQQRDKVVPEMEVAEPTKEVLDSVPTDLIDNQPEPEASTVAAVPETNDSAVPTQQPEPVDPTQPIAESVDSVPTESINEPTESAEPVAEPIVEPTVEPIVEPTVEPIFVPTVDPAVEPIVEPTVEPIFVPTVDPAVEPIVEPTVEPAVEPTVEPIFVPTVEPTVEPIFVPTVEPIFVPTVEPIVEPTVEPIFVPTVEPAVEPIVEPTVEPAVEPAVEPIFVPAVEPIVEPTVEPIFVPAAEPEQKPEALPKVDDDAIDAVTRTVSVQEASVGHSQGDTEQYLVTKNDESVQVEEPTIDALAMAQTNDDVITATPAIVEMSAHSLVEPDAPQHDAPQPSEEILHQEAVLETSTHAAVEQSSETTETHVPASAVGIEVAAATSGVIDQQQDSPATPKPADSPASEEPKDKQEAIPAPLTHPNPTQPIGTSDPVDKSLPEAPPAVEAAPTNLAKSPSKSSKCCIM